jgi:hypothetical protein
MLAVNWLLACREIILTQGVLVTYLSNTPVHVKHQAILLIAATTKLELRECSSADLGMAQTTALLGTNTTFCLSLRPISLCDLWCGRHLQPRVSLEASG